MYYEPSEIIEASKNKEMLELAFGLAIREYPQHGYVVMPQASDGYDYLAVSECRGCGGLITTLAMNDGGILMPMSAGTGPQCNTDRCGDKVSTICYAVYEIVDAPDDPTSKGKTCASSENNAPSRVATQSPGQLLELAKLMNFMRLDYIERNIVTPENLTDEMMTRLALFHSAISSVQDAALFLEETAG